MSDEFQRPTGPTPGRHLLIVDDNPTVIEVIGAFLEVLGHTHEVARDGQVALAVMSEHRFDLVLMDRRMPGLYGDEVTRRFRLQEAAGEHTPIVAITADPGGPEGRLCLDAGMDDLLPKPFSLAQFRALLTRWLAPASPPDTNG